MSFPRFIPVLYALMPAFAFAAPNSFASLVDIFLGIINLLIPVVFGLTFLVFLWGISRSWIAGAGDEKKLEEGKKIALVGVIVLVVMVGIWGILWILQDSIFGDNYLY